VIVLLFYEDLEKQWRSHGMHAEAAGGEAAGWLAGYILDLLEFEIRKMDRWHHTPPSHFLSLMWRWWYV
jgi:hypothetical protein